MAKALRRILRIRHLAEEQARLEVERAAQRARQASAACARQSNLEREQRSTLAASWIGGQNDGPASLAHSAGAGNDPREGTEEKGWLMEEAMLEFFGWRRMRLEKLRETELARMEPLIANYTECRRELRQTEQLLEQQAGKEAMEQIRRAQAATDEWFSQRTRSQQRRKIQQTEPRQPEDSSGEVR